MACQHSCNPSDPYYWTGPKIIDKVLERRPLPPEDEAMLRRVFEQHHLDGSALLDTSMGLMLDMQVLRDDIAIHSWGLRREILVVLEELRSQTIHYQQLRKDQDRAGIEQRGCLICNPDARLPDTVPETASTTLPRFLGLKALSVRHSLFSGLEEMDPSAKTFIHTYRPVPRGESIFLARQLRRRVLVPASKALYGMKLGRRRIVEPGSTGRRYRSASRDMCRNSPPPVFIAGEDGILAEVDDPCRNIELPPYLTFTSTEEGVLMEVEDAEDESDAAIVVHMRSGFDHDSTFPGEDSDDASEPALHRQSRVQGLGVVRYPQACGRPEWLAIMGMLRELIREPVARAGCRAVGNRRRGHGQGRNNPHRSPRSVEEVLRNDGASIDVQKMISIIKELEPLQLNVWVLTTIYECLLTGKATNLPEQYWDGIAVIITVLLHCYCGYGDISRPSDIKIKKQCLAFLKIMEFDDFERFYDELCGALGIEIDGDLRRINSNRYVRYVIYEGENDEPDVVLHPAFSRTLKPYQLDGVKFLWREVLFNPTSQGALVSQMMGLGKTVQVIAFLYTLAEVIESGKHTIPQHLVPQRILVVCPPGLLSNWLDEFERWIGRLPPQHRDILGQRYVYTPENVKEWHEGRGILLIGYQKLSKIMNCQPQGEPFQDLGENFPHSQSATLKDYLRDGTSLIVADEVHKIKNPDSQISKAVRSIKTAGRIALSGSPLSNCLYEYFSVLDWIDPGVLGGYENFVRTFEDPILKGLYVDSSEAEKLESTTRLGEFIAKVGGKVNRKGISFLKENLKEKYEFRIHVPLTARQRGMYQEYLKRVQRTGRGTQWYLGIVHKLRVLCNHLAAFYPPRNARTVTHEQLVLKRLADRYRKAGDDSIDQSNKMQVVFALLKECKKRQDKVLVFSHSLRTLDYLEQQCRRQSLKFQRLDGNTPPTRRQDIVKLFNDRPYDLMLLSTKAGNDGLNLQGANRVILVDEDFNPTSDIQAVGRAYRLGQQKKVFVYRFTVDGSMESRLANLITLKLGLQDKVLDMLSGRSAERQLVGWDFYMTPPQIHTRSKPLDLMVCKNDPVLRKLAEKFEFILNIETEMQKEEFTIEDIKKAHNAR